MTDAPDPLQAALAAFYSDYVLKGKPMTEAVQPIRDLMIVQPDVHGAARIKLAELDALAASTGGNLQSRCYVSHIQRSALREILNG